VFGCLRRCDGWAQCPLCPHPDNPRFPAQSGDPRCAPRIRHRCPTTGICCYQNRACCNQLLGCDDDCLEFIPSPCSSMAAINCTPNLPPSGYSVLGWRPGPPASRTCPRTQYPSAPYSSPKLPPEPACRRPCEARYLQSPARPFTLRHHPDKPWPVYQPPCNPPPPVPTYTCRSIGSRRLTEHIQFKHSYPGRSSLCMTHAARVVVSRSVVTVVRSSRGLYFSLFGVSIWFSERP